MMDIREKLVELIREGATEYIHPNLVDEIADHLIANNVTVQEWIPVTERLPQEDGDYLVTTNYFGKHQSINIRCFAKDGKTVIGGYDLAGHKYVWYFYDSEYGYVSTDSVTHWMPLPTPPKGE